MKIMPIIANPGYSALCINNKRKFDRYAGSPLRSNDQISFKSGTTIVGGFLTGVAATIAISTVAPLAILGAGAVAIGGAVIGSKINDNDNEDEV